MTTKKTPRTIPFTASRLERLQPPASGRIVFHDAKCPGLTLRISSSGAKSFVIQRRVNGKPTRLMLGRFPETSIASAREQAGKAHDEFNAGTSPLETRKARQTEARLREQSNLTLSEVWTEYEAHLKQRCSKNAPRNHGYFFVGLESLKARKLADITPADIKKLQRRLLSNGRVVMADMVLEFLRRLYLFASDEMGSQAEFPVSLERAGGTRRRTGRKGKPVVYLSAKKFRQRVLMQDEARRLLTVLADEGDITARDLILCLLFIGQRKSSVRAMKWSDLNLTDAVWRVSGEGSKGIETTIPLTSPAVKILKSRRAIVPADSEWVFPTVGVRGSASGHITEIRACWDRIRGKSKLTDLTLHDLRRSYGSWQRWAGADREIIGRSLGHCDGSDATKIYDRLDMSAVRQSVGRASAKLLEAGTVSIETILSVPVAESGED